jgi:hypothetical protein
MDAAKLVVCMACTASLLLASCAVSPEAENRRLQKQASIAEILSQPLDPAEYGETKRCLSETEYRSFRALDDRHILFRGSRNRRWINTLRAPCPDLRYGDVLIVRQFNARRMCDMDTFEVADWFAWPWYRRWPWRWGMNWGVGMRCSLGKFQPVTESQVEEIEAVIRSR